MCVRHVLILCRAAAVTNTDGQIATEGTDRPGEEVLRRLYPMQQTGEDHFYEPDVKEVLDCFTIAENDPIDELKLELRKRVVNVFNRQLVSTLLSSSCSGIVCKV